MEFVPDCESNVYLASYTADFSICCFAKMPSLEKGPVHWVSGEGTKMLECLKQIHGPISVLGSSSRRILDSLSILMTRSIAKGAPHGGVQDTPLLCCIKKTAKMNILMCSHHPIFYSINASECEWLGDQKLITVIIHQWLFLFPFFLSFFLNLDSKGRPFFFKIIPFQPI